MANKRQTKKKPLTSKAGIPATFEAAYDRLKPRFQSLEKGELIAANVDLQEAAAIALAAAPKIAAMKDSLALMPGNLVAAARDLPDIARAAYFVAATTREGEQQVAVTEMVEAGVALRALLLTSARSLDTFDLIDMRSAPAIGTRRGHFGIANDLTNLASLFEARWTQVKNATPVQPEQLAEAKAISEGLVRAVGKQRAFRSEASVARAQAHTLLKRTYDALRLALNYLRVDYDDAQEIAPNWLSSRGKKRTPRVEVDAPITVDEGETAIDEPVVAEAGPEAGRPEVGPAESLTPLPVSGPPASEPPLGRPTRPGTTAGPERPRPASVTEAGAGAPDARVEHAPLPAKPATPEHGPPSPVARPPAVNGAGAANGARPSNGAVTPERC